MGCNCGDNEYNITVDNNGNCEPTTPIYNITLANVGVNGYSPIVKFINETIDSFNIAVDNVTGTETSPAVPKLSYVSDQINNINTTIANLGDTYLTVNGSNATLPFTIGDFKILSDGSVRVTNENITGYLNVKEIRPRNASGITIGYTTSGSYPINLITNDKAYYNSKEIATVDQIPTVGNGTITLTQGGVTKGTFTTNQSGNTTIELDAGGGSITNPLDIKNSDNTRSISLGINSDNQAYMYYNIRTEGAGFSVPVGLLYLSSNTIDFTERSADGLYTIEAKEMVGCDSITGGASGLVPAPSAGDQDKFLKADGTWDTVGGGGSSYTAGTGINITNNTISVDESVVMTTSNQSTINFGAKQFSHITIANGYSTGEGLYGWLDDGSSTIPLVRVSDLDDVIIGDGGSKLVLHGNETRPSYFNGQTTSYLALYSDIPDVSQLQEKLTAGDGITIEKTLDGAMTPDWYLNDVALDPVPSTIATPAVGVTNTYKPYNNQTFSNTADEINIVWDVLYANTSSATGGFIKATGSDGAITLSFDGGYQGASSYFNVKCNINSSDVVDETLYVPYQDATYIRGAFTFNNTTKVWSITFTNTTTNTVIASQAGTTSVNIIPTNSLITIQMLNANGSQNGITIKTDTFTVSASNTEITQISVDNTVVALQSDLPTNYLTTNTSQTISTGTKTMASGTSQVFVSGSSLDIRGNNTLFLRGASQAQGGYLGLSGRSRDTVNNVAINVIRLQANTTSDLANLRLQGYDLYSNPYLYNGFTRLGQVSVSSGDVNIITESGVELQYNGNEIATVNNIPTKTSDLTNDSGYITASALNGYAKTVDLATVATSGSYNDLSDKPTIPSAVTEMTVSGWGFTKNTGTVTSVNNVSPVNGNVTLSIPSTDNLADTSLSNLSTTGQAVIDGKVSKSGDTMTGALSIALSGDDTYNLIIQNDSIERFITPSTQNQTRIQFVDKNGDDIGSIYYQQRTDGSSRLSQVLRNNLGGDAYAYIGYDKNGNTNCSFPNTDRVDGQWVKKSATLATNVTWKANTAAKTYSLSSYLPNDDYSYEVLFSGVAVTGTTSGNFVTIQLSTTFVDNVSVCEARTRTSSSTESQGNAILPIGSDRAVTQYSSSSTNANGTYSLYVRAYRRIGKNS